MKDFTKLKIGERFRLTATGRNYVKTGELSYGYEAGSSNKYETEKR
jgi:hypothetical protein